MSDERPLRVLVAEALGCKPKHDSAQWVCTCLGDANCNRPHGDPDEPFDPLWPYGEDSPEGWACTGPLLARFGMDVTERTTVPQSWVAEFISDRGQTFAGRGDNPCEAIARCVVALAAAGKLAARPPSS